MKSLKSLKRKYQLPLWPLFLLWLMASSFSYAQESTITGTVTDGGGQPLPGANVLVKGTTMGTQTDFDGNFTISASSDAILVFSYLGFTSQEVAVNGRSSINLSMIEDASQLDEVVIVGYGTQKKSDLTGSVGQINGDDINKFTTGNATSALQGRVAGVRIDTNGGAPGAQANVTIRGISTLSNAGPLYVVDGLLTGGIQNLNPADIESISVLKDASASAIYGQRAANGVIIVTTKKGKSGEIAVDVDFNAGFAQVINQLEFANARQYADIRNAANDNDGQPRAPANDTQFNPNIDTEIHDASLRSGPQYNANIRVSGGSENGSYSISTGRFKADGIVKASGLERNTFRVNTSFKKGRFKLEQNLNLSQTKTQTNPYFNRERDHIPTAPIWTTNPLFDGGFTATADPTGGIGFHGVEDVINSLGLAELEERLNTLNAVQGNIIASFELFDGLVYKLNAGIDYGDRNEFRFRPTYFFANSNGGRNFINELDERNTRGLTTLVENTLNYNKEFGKHTLGLLAGYTEQKTNTRQLGIVATNFPSNDIRVANAAENIQQAPSFETIAALRSWIGRVNYSFDNKYSLTGTIRRDGSSLFTNELRFGTFYSAGFAWSIINEAFMEDQSFFDALKLRMSYGETGSNNIDPYSISPVLNTNSQFIDSDGNRVQGFAITNGTNADLQWETTTTTNIGLDMAFMENRLQLTADYFVRNSRDILVGLTPSTFLGFGNQVPQNAADIQNKGLEFLVNYNTQIGDLRLGLSANFTTVKNELISFGNEDQAPIIGGDFTSNGNRSMTRTEPGRSIAEFYAYKVLGIYQTDAEATADGRVDAVAGDLRFQDTNGDGELNDEDKVYLGSSAPKFEYGFNVDLGYKNWDLAMFFDGVSGNKVVNGNKWRFTFDTTSNYYPEVLNAWTPSNTNTTVPRATLLDTGGNGRPSDYLLENGSYFRLRNTQIGYSFPEKTTSFLKLSRLRLYASTEFLFTATEYTGFYPEIGRGNRGNNVSIFNQGVDEAAYPRPRTFQFGAQISF